jgi:two-component sensor histidine kinase
MLEPRAAAGKSMSFSPRSILRQAWRDRFAYVVCVLGVAAATIVTDALPPLHATPNILFLVVVVATAWYGGRGPAIVAIILSALAVDYFLVPPLYSVLTSIADVMRLIEYALVAGFILYLQHCYLEIARRLKEANDVLEARVGERTADLAAANESLQREVHERQDAEAALRASEANLRDALETTANSLREKDVLLRELNHRVKNNLQIITSLLSLQRARITDRGTQELFAECQNRVRAIALAHQRLCRAPSLAEIDLAAYFDQLVRELSRSYSVGTGTVETRVNVDQIVLSVDHLVPTSLIVNELVCNALKYAFPEGRSGEVCVDLHRENGMVNVTVADNGVGFTPDCSKPQTSVGLRIVEALVEQLSGKIHWANGLGTRATVTFPEADS